MSCSLPCRAWGWINHCCSGASPFVQLAQHFWNSMHGLVSGWALYTPLTRPWPWRAGWWDPTALGCPETQRWGLRGGVQDSGLYSQAVRQQETPGGFQCQMQREHPAARKSPPKWGEAAGGGLDTKKTTDEKGVTYTRGEGTCSPEVSAHLLTPQLLPLQKSVLKDYEM